jgi:hypothetical protein
MLWRHSAATLILLATLTMPSHAGEAQTPPCRGNPKLVGDCFTVHGRIATKNGGPAMPLWIAGTKRYLGVLCWGIGNDCCELPDNAEFVREHPPGELRTYGNFEVCPFTKERPAWMQFVCVEKASDLVVERWDEATHSYKYVSGPAK